jgi:hypothetical protein
MPFDTKVPKIDACPDMERRVNLLAGEVLSVEFQEPGIAGENLECGCRKWKVCRIVLRVNASARNKASV